MSEDREDYTAEEATIVARAMALKEQAKKFLKMKELWAEFEKGMAITDSKADATFGEEHQRHIGAKQAIKEWLSQVRWWAAYEAPEKKKTRNNYA